jgi:hypothetical protein
MNFTFFKRPKPRQFNYIPRYYDPVKEELEERKKQLGLLGEGDIKERMRADIRRKWRVEKGPAVKQVVYIRVFIYLLFSVFAIYFIFFTDFINKLVSFFVR